MLALCRSKLAEPPVSGGSSFVYVDQNWQNNQHPVAALGVYVDQNWQNHGLNAMQEMRVYAGNISIPHVFDMLRIFS